MGNYINYNKDIVDKLYDYDQNMVIIKIFNPLFNELKYKFKKKIDDKRGAFLFLDEEKNIIFFLYAKLNRESLARSLPISYKDSKFPEENYISLIIDKDGRDYIGQTSKISIDEVISLNKMQNLLDGNYNLMKLVLPNLDKETYDGYKNFSSEQFMNLPE